MTAQEQIEVLGRSVTLPVEVREARSAAATFLVRHDAALALMAGTGLEPKRLPGGRALCVLAAVSYRDNDLGPYNEVAFSIAVGATRDAPAGAYIHQLPVDGAFTLAAGREIWGFPKWRADFDLSIDDRRARCRLSQDGALIVDLTVRARPLPLPSKPVTMTAYARIDGVTRRTPFESRTTGVRGGPMGATLVVGDRHPMALELRSLGLPRRAIASSVIGNMAATFGAAEVLAP